MTDTTTDLDRPLNATAIHNHGFVHLDLWAGTELDIVNAARVSHAKQSNYEFQEGMAGEELDMFLNPADVGLLEYLMKHKHGTPFEMVWMRWHIKAPIFVFREWHRHRIASINEMSGRYVELKPEFYLPDDEHVRVQTGKRGHYTYEPAGTKDISDEHEGADLTYGEYTRTQLLRAYNFSYTAYQKMLGVGVAKEIARACLPVATYSEMYWAVNLRSLLNFLSLRNHPRAMQELQDYAQVMENELELTMPTVWNAFIENDRVAP